MEFLRIQFNILQNRLQKIQSAVPNEGYNVQNRRDLEDLLTECARLEEKIASYEQEYQHFIRLLQTKGTSPAQFLKIKDLPPAFSQLVKGNGYHIYLKKLKFALAKLQEQGRKLQTDFPGQRTDLIAP